MDKKDFGYEYTISLCSAIEKFTKEEETKNSSFFVYKGSNLKFAMERTFYFQYVNDENLFTIFRSCQKGKIPKEIFVENFIERSLISKMCNISPNQIFIRRKRLGTKIRDLVRSVLRFFILATRLHKLAEKLRFLAFENYRPEISPQICFCVDNAKFIRYMEPVTSKIDFPFVFLSYNEKSLKYLENKKIPYIKMWSKLYFLERWAKKKDAFYKFVIHDRYDFVEKVLSQLKPHLRSVVMAEGNAPHDEMVNQICKKLGIECICIQQGWSPVMHNGFRNMSYSKMLVWGEGFAKLFKPFNPDQKFVATGSHSVVVSDPKERQGKEKASVVFFIQEKSRLLSEDMLLAFVDLANRISKELPKVKIILAGKGGYQLTEELKKIKGVEVVSKAAEIPLQDIFDMGDMIVSVYSTVILESVAVGKLPIILNVTSMPRYFPDVDKIGAGIEVKNSDEAFQAIKNLIENPIEIDRFKEPMKNFTKEFFYENRESALKNIIGEIKNV